MLQALRVGDLTRRACTPACLRVDRKRGLAQAVFASPLREMSVAKKNLLTVWPKLTKEEQEIVVFAAKHCGGLSTREAAMFWCRKNAIAGLRKLNEISDGYGREVLGIIRKIETSD